ITAEQSQGRKTILERKGITPLFDKSVPPSGGTLPVRPSTTSALGTICASVTYTANAPGAAQALVYPAEYFPSPPPATPPGQAVPGTMSTVGSSVIFTWNSSN